ncbi:hypothetical protein N7G274_007362 [Stereocaulon virgatum]|uniref:DNA-directed RNA polymerase n=1 Tax=Stereocaulon virgatum TaxID=373712 RepID=A0ABR4A1X1_9LECA
MFVRASRRSLQNDPFKQLTSDLEILHLPFLCPALCIRRSFVRSTSTSSKPWINSELKHPHAKARHSRGLASAAAVECEPRPDYDVAWDPASYSKPNASPRFNKQSKANFPSFDSQTSPIIINDTMTTHPKQFRSLNAISGDINEIHQTLHACLQVGRLERAASLVRRLNQIYRADAPGLLAAHNDYVKELTHRIVRTGDQQLLQVLQQWFEVDLYGKGVMPDEVTYASMIQASLQTTGSKKPRTVRRYVGLAKEAGLHKETMELLSTLKSTAVADVDSVSTVPVQSPSESDQPSLQVADQEPGAANSMSCLTTEAALQVRGTPQKGYGLMTLKKSLRPVPVLADLHNPSDHLNRTTVNNEERQRFLERNTLGIAMERWHAEHAHLKSIGINSGLGNPTIGGMMWQWHEKLILAIKDEIRKSHEAEDKEIRNPSDRDRLLWAPYMQSLKPDKMSAVTILTSIQCCSTDVADERGVRLHAVVSKIGDAVAGEFYADKLRKSRRPSIWRDLGKMAKSARQRLSRAKPAYESISSDDDDDFRWGKATRIRLGAVLLSHLMDIAKVQVSHEDPVTKETVSELQPVFFHTYQYVLGKRVGVVRLHTALVEKLTSGPVASALAKHLPMLVKPRPWVGYREGGFLETLVAVVRLNSSDQNSKRYAMAASRNGDMSQVFAGLDVLGKTPWRINRFVFDIMVQVWNTGKAFAKIPPENPPNDFADPPPASDDHIARGVWLRKRRQFDNRRFGLRSQRCFQNFQLEVARAYLNETFYFPHNVDFRGRAYPLAPFMNHMGSDHCRGLLMFAEAKELTTEGLWWLKVHLANVYGYDKASFSERLQFTEDHLAEICDSANNPLDGSGWWIDAEDPWQCLAACKELKNALDLPDPTRYVCQLPIHQDGTCNGLQHYAALGGDAVGAQQVNLEPGQRPSDVYTGVAEIVKAQVAEHAAQGKKLAQALEGKLSRKIVKQTVMTNVYGVTFVGAKTQVQKQLEDALPDFPDLPGINRSLASSYIAKEIFTALSSMFKGAHEIQYWLTNCAGRISESIAPAQAEFLAEVAGAGKIKSQYRTKSLKGTPKNEIAAFKSAVIWTTPLKMPVVQPYRKESARAISTTLQRINVHSRSTANPIDKAKQVKAFPPNFIHSLDATHMFLTALKCDEVGLTFAAIHDSFWTHAGDVDTMNAIIRDAFISIHSHDIIGRLAAEFKARYKDYMHLAGVPSGSPIALKIRAWRNAKYRAKGLPQEWSGKKLNSQKCDEMLLERRRLTLLASEDPGEREEGEKMITPGSLFEKAADEDLIAPTDVKITPIGGMAPRTADVNNMSAKVKVNQQIEVGDIEKAEVVHSDVIQDIDAAAAPEAGSKMPKMLKLQLSTTMQKTNQRMPRLRLMKKRSLI